VYVLGLALILAEVGLACYLLRLRPDPVLALATPGGALTALLGGFVLYEDRWGYSRAFALLPLGVWLTCAQARWRWPLAATAAAAVLPLAVVAKAWMGHA
jgi:hypothetical protein